MLTKANIPALIFSFVNGQKKRQISLNLWVMIATGASIQSPSAITQQPNKIQGRLENRSSSSSEHSEECIDTIEARDNYNSYELLKADKS
jgi:hypothetical protein